MRVFLLGVLILGFLGSKAVQAQLKAGDPAPCFALPDQDGKLRQLADFRGKTIALYFYPKDDTPGCTREACNLRDKYNELSVAGVVVLGVSYDSPESHAAFRQKHHLPFPLLADTNHAVAEAYGVKGLLGAKRVTFLIDKERIIRHIFDSVDTGSHAQQILAILENK